MNNKRLPFINPNQQLISPQDMAAANRRRLDGEPLPAPYYASPGMADVILTACDPEPGKRFASAKEMKTALLHIAEGNYGTGHFEPFEETDRSRKQRLLTIILEVSLPLGYTV